MDNFVKGISTVGQLFPPPCPYPAQAQGSAWADTANSFRQAGNSLRRAMKDFSDTQREGRPDDSRTAV
jgi:hypothetical protein